ncbi:MAG TPA: M17 family peptidase N-terminal domain-containing protein, partial [Streptosporangiaceae bacterium]
MTASLQTSQTPAHDVSAHAVIIGVIQNHDGPRPAPGAEDVDAAFGGSLAQTLTALGATGKPEELTRIATGGQLQAPLIVAVGLGPDAGRQEVDGEVLRRAAGAAVRSLSSGQQRQIALSLPARNAAEIEAVALGALLGGYAFGKYRNGARLESPQLTLLAKVDLAAGAASRSQVIADAMALVRDMVNTSPSQLYPESFAAQAASVAEASGLSVEVLDENQLAAGGYGGLIGVGQGS